MQITKSKDILNLSIGESINKKSLFRLIQLSKIPDSEFWSGERYIINNTPQQGINWIGSSPAVEAVIVKTRQGSYLHDGWVDGAKRIYRYSFKEKKGVVHFSELANKVLVNQPEFGYPILLFIENEEDWVFEGRFSVVEIAERFVVLENSLSFRQIPVTFEAEEYREGGRRYVSHLMAERSKRAVDILKANNAWICDICQMDFNTCYGIPYIEAHHKIPISTFSDRHSVRAEDFSLLCPNCHKAVHIYMKRLDIEYEEIRLLLQTDKVQSRR